MSLPPVVNWRYNYQPRSSGSAEAELNDYLRPRDWLEESWNIKKPRRENQAGFKNGVGLGEMTDTLVR